MNLRNVKLAAVAAVSIFGSLALMVSFHPTRAQSRSAADGSDILSEIAGYRTWEQVHKPIGPDFQLVEGGVLSVISPAEIAL